GEDHGADRDRCVAIAGWTAGDAVVFGGVSAFPEVDGPGRDGGGVLSGVDLLPERQKARGIRAVEDPGNEAPSVGVARRLAGGVPGAAEVPAQDAEVFIPV